MAQESRAQKSLLNARVSVFYLCLSVVISFFSRKIFLDTLGTNFLGLTSTLNGLLGFLSLAELGIGTAIGVSLYKPLADKNHEEINEVMSVMAYFYRYVGIVVLGAGIVLSLFLPIIFEREKDVSLLVIYLAYYAFFCSSLFTYFFNYKQTLLSADQRNYEVTKYSQAANIAKYILQMTCAYYWESPYIWIALELLFGILFCIILNRRIRKVYPWLDCSPLRGKLLHKKFPEIGTYTKQLFLQRIGVLVLNNVSPILMYSFSSLTAIALYSNYTMVSGKLSLFVEAFLGSTSASVGNLIAEGDKNKIHRVFRQILCIRFFIAGFFIFLLYNLTDPFIALWLGEEYVLDRIILYIILASTFITYCRGAIDQFLYGYKLFKDVWSIYALAVLFLIFAIIGGRIWGLAGVAGGSVLAHIIITGIWKPYFLFSQGFKVSVWKYWCLYFTHAVIIAVSALLTSGIVRLFPEIELNSYVNWIKYACLLGVSYLCINIVLLYLFAPEMKDVIVQFKFMLSKRKDEKK